MKSVKNTKSYKWKNVLCTVRPGNNSFLTNDWVNYELTSPALLFSNWENVVNRIQLLSVCRQTVLSVCAPVCEMYIFLLLSLIKEMNYSTCYITTNWCYFTSWLLFASWYRAKRYSNVHPLLPANRTAEMPVSAGCMCWACVTYSVIAVKVGSCDQKQANSNDSLAKGCSNIHSFL